MKEETRSAGPWQYGDDAQVAEQQGQRSDLLSVKRRIDEGVFCNKKGKKISFFLGASEAELADEFFASWVRHHKAFKRYRAVKTPKRNWEMEVIVLIGDTGTGKSRWIAENFPDAYYLPEAKASGCYWDGYEAHETVAVEECYGNRFSHGHLLQLLDRYPMQVPVHGGFTEFSSRRIILTSNAHPAEWYDAQRFPFEGGALQRRMTQGRSRIVRVDPGGIHTVLEGYEPVEEAENNNNNNVN
jgi:hypothetical protein